MRRTAMPYKDAVRWIAVNDDTEWLDDENGCISVSASLVADLYGRTEREITDDLRRTLENMR